MNTTTLSIIAISIKQLFATFSIMTLSITTLCHYTKCYYAECRILSIVVLNAIMASFFILNVNVICHKNMQH